MTEPGFELGLLKSKAFMLTHLSVNQAMMHDGQKNNRETVFLPSGYAKVTENG